MLFDRGPRTLILAGAITLALSGCSTSGSSGNGDASESSVYVDPAMVKLTEAANEIRESHRILAYAESARSSESGAADPSKTYKPEDFPREWRQDYALAEDFYGELEPFLRGLSKVVGYDKPQVVGDRPVVPITVSMNRTKRPLGEYLVDASYQAGGRAKVTLDEEAGRLKITYGN